MFKAQWPARALAAMKIHLHTEESGERAAINQSRCVGEDSGKTGTADALELRGRSPE